MLSSSTFKNGKNGAGGQLQGLELVFAQDLVQSLALHGPLALLGIAPKQEKKMANSIVLFATTSSLNNIKTPVTVGGVSAAQ